MKETVGTDLPQSITGKYDELYIWVYWYMSDIRFRAQVGLEALVTKCPSNSKLAIHPRNITCKQTIEHNKVIASITYNNDKTINTTKIVPGNVVTKPPCFSILCLSLVVWGSWSTVSWLAEPLSHTTARESPTFAIHMSLPSTTIAVTAVEPPGPSCLAFSRIYVFVEQYAFFIASWGLDQKRGCSNQNRETVRKVCEW